ncbi:MAG: NADPH-dependent glutamate synthase [Candidatus Undinarchaeales archaeon]|jgi:glutamate synthase (NADPH/NADH) small chain|nr:NADPH-dependent glutamate synthase [Candidatus Undinarchaeales archaeon]MDP7492174.1 NADPH-dependent glutamate synthase [Candidatus Undinarchaeales archaeon]
MVKPGERDRVKMPEQLPEVRARNFEEVPLGLTAELAVAEAERCLNCKKPFCVDGCPVSVKIPEFISLISEGRFAEAARKVKETNALPAVCGRVCPQEVQCEARCVLGKKYEPVAIGYLERFVADHERENDLIELAERAPSTGKKVAVIGAGPSGLTVAGDLIKLGHDVVIFEALHKPGGVLTYGIPEFRLPMRVIEAEVANLLEQGVSLEMDSVIGKVRTVRELMEEDGFDTVFIGVGAGLPRFMGVPGENLNGIYSSNEYLTRSNLMNAFRFPEYDTPVERARKAVVIGGGNVAMDSVRTALRLGAKDAIIAYRRAREQLPARTEEIHHAEQEGVRFHFLTAPIRFIGDDRGFVKAMECICMELGEPDASGRRRPVPIEGSNFIMEADLVVIAVGTNSNPLLTSTMPELELNKWGNIVTNEDGATNIEGVYAGGDIVTGSATVIEAMGAGRRAARAMHEYMTEGRWKVERKESEK